MRFRDRIILNDHDLGVGLPVMPAGKRQSAHLSGHADVGSQLHFGDRLQPSASPPSGLFLFVRVLGLLLGYI
jgi:hypothetical protein